MTEGTGEAREPSEAERGRERALELWRAFYEGETVEHDGTRWRVDKVEGTQNWIIAGGEWVRGERTIDVTLVDVRGPDVTLVDAHLRPDGVLKEYRREIHKDGITVIAGRASY